MPFATHVAPRTPTPSRAAGGWAPARGATARNLGLSAVVLVAAAAVATHGSEATFTASASRGHSIVTGSSALAFGALGASTNRLGADVANLAPGQSAYRSFDITNTGTLPFSSYTLSVTVSSHSLLDTDRTNGIQMMLQRCSTSWTEAGTGPSWSYTCGGTTSTVVPSGALMQTAVPLAGMASAAPGGTDHLLLTEMLPSTADNSFQALTSAVTYAFNAS